jgi:transposase
MEAERVIEGLRRENQVLRGRIETLKKENADLRRKLAERERSAKRQAAPFSKGQPKAEPRKPGRKKGADYGKRAARPQPKHIDAEYDVQLPEHCPHCGGSQIDELGNIDEQFQTDLPPVRPRVTKFRVHSGVCRDCGRAVRGRHPEQTSDAVGAANNQIGPQAIATAAELNKVYGLSYGKIARVFERLFAFPVARSALVRALGRLARRSLPAYEQVKQVVRGAPVVYPDETGWRVGGRLAWLWVFVSKFGVFFIIRPSRGADVIDEVIGLDYSGKVGHDGWAPYDQLSKAIHQTCQGHILRRCDVILEGAKQGAARFPHAVKQLLHDAFVLRDRRDRGEISSHGLAVCIGKLEKRLSTLVNWSPTFEPNRKLAKHLRAHEDQVLTFLRHPDLEATSWPADHAIRPAVVNRKVWGGNRTWDGAVTQAVLTTVFRTCLRLDHEPISYLVQILKTPPSQPLPALFAGP